MDASTNSCYRCKEVDSSQLLTLHGYVICGSCQSKLRLFNDKTILNYIHKFDNPAMSNNAYLEDVDSKLEIVERIYIDKKIKLKHIRKRIIELTKP